PRGTVIHRTCSRRGSTTPRRGRSGCPPVSFSVFPLKGYSRSCSRPIWIGAGPRARSRSCPLPGEPPASSWRMCATRAGGRMGTFASPAWFRASTSSNTPSGKVLYRSDGRGSFPSVSPNGRDVAFVAVDEAVHVIDAGGRERTLSGEHGQVYGLA